jgi:hypothetical protein
MAKIKKRKKISVVLIPMMIFLITFIIMISGILNKPRCGNNECETGEACTSCPQDCGSCPTTTTIKITTTTVPTTTTLLPTTTTFLPNITTTKITDSCTDTDGGVKYDVQGTVSGYHLGNPFSYTDYCINDLLKEYYCLTYYGTKEYNCAYAGKKCVDGACV